MGPRAISVALTGMLLLAGCVAQLDAASTTEGSAEAATQARRMPVVALLDSEINVYHSAFSSDVDWSAVLERIPDATLFRPSDLPDVAAAERADGVLLQSVPKGSLVAFDGTRTMGVSMMGDASMLLTGTQDHGTSTSYAVAAAAPHALILMVQFHGFICDPGEACLISETFADAMEWVADQPWIDVVSISVGLPGNLPDHPAVHAEMERFLLASKRAHDSGKLIVTSAGNDPTVTLTDYIDGPPWAIAVGGAHGAQRGEHPTSSKAVDVVANYTQYVAMSEGRDAYRWASGTSLSTPLVAGTLAEALWIARSDPSHAADPPPPSAWRDALNASAVLFDATDWSPTGTVANDTYWNTVSRSIPVVFAPAQMGWGFVEASLASEIARRVIENDLSIPPEKADAAQFQAHRQALREAYWKAHLGE